MTYYFLDSSAFVKYYADEEGSDEVRALLARAFMEPSDIEAIVCDLVVPETVSALSRKVRRGEDPSLVADIHYLLGAVVADVLSPQSPFVVIESSGVVSHAPSVIMQHGLTGSDAVQLAAALAARAHTPYGISFIFVAADLDLVEAARREGFEIMEELLPTRAGH